MGASEVGQLCLVDFSGPAGPYRKLPMWPEGMSADKEGSGGVGGAEGSSES